VEGLALYRGDLLDGLSVEAEGFNDWLNQERLRFRTIAAHVFDRCIEAREQRGDADGAILAAERLVALDPANEGTQRRLIDLLARYRGRTAALAQAEMTRKLIRGEFDSDLEPATLQMIERLKTSAAVVRPAERRVDETQTIEHAPAALVTQPDLAVTDCFEHSRVSDQPAGEAVMQPPVPQSRDLRRWTWRTALALLVGFGAIVAYAWQRAPQESPSSGAVAAQAPDPAWHSPNTVLPGAAVSRALEGRGKSALLVLPFAAIPADSVPTSRMAGLLSDDLVNDLSRVPGLRVIARSTSLQYAGQSVDVAMLGTELGVQYVLEGNVRVDGTKVRLNVALIDTKTRLHVWTERYERDDTDRPQVQDEILRAIARQLQVSVMESRGRAPANSTIDSMLGKGWAALNQFAFLRGGLDSGQLFQNVLALDPKNVSALTGLGAFKSTAYNTGQITEGRESLLLESENLLKQAQNLDPQASLPLYFLGRLAMVRQRPDEALAYFARTLILNPSYAPAHGAIGYVLLHTKRLQEALDNLTYAIRLSPKDHYLGLWSAHVGRVHFELGNFDEAERWLSQGVSLMPNSFTNRIALVAFYSYRDNSAAVDAQIIELKKLRFRGTSAGLISRFTTLCKHDDDKPQRLLSGLNKVWASLDPAR
jgi:TolB-like protein/lipoprotein NlpI